MFPQLKSQIIKSIKKTCVINKTKSNNPNRFTQIPKNIIIYGTKNMKNPGINQLI